MPSFLAKRCCKARPGSCGVTTCWCVRVGGKREKARRFIKWEYSRGSWPRPAFFRSLFLRVQKMKIRGKLVRWYKSNRVSNKVMASRKVVVRAGACRKQKHWRFQNSPVVCGNVSAKPTGLSDCPRAALCARSPTRPQATCDATRRGRCQNRDARSPPVRAEYCG